MKKKRKERSGKKEIKRLCDNAFVLTVGHIDKNNNYYNI